jgi:hypothetical protein
MAIAVEHWSAMADRLLSVEHDQLGRGGAQGQGLGALKGGPTRTKTLQLSSSESTREVIGFRV